MLFSLTKVYGKLRWVVLVPCLLLLSGCFQYDLTLRFDHQLHGQIVQTIDLSDRAVAVAQGTLAPWFNQLENRTRQLGGRVIKTGYNQLELAVPFTTSDDLVKRFDRLFTDTLATTGPSAETDNLSHDIQSLTIPGLGQATFRLAIDQTNWVLASRTHLIYDIDLRELPPGPAAPGDDPQQPIWSDLGFQLQTPWGLGQVAAASTSPTVLLPNGGRWRLQPGETYHIDVRFWVPSLVALGTLAIAVAVILGYFLRYRVWRRSNPAPSR